MMQIPLIYRQPGTIPANKQSDVLVSNYDFLPTVLAYLGLSDRMRNRPMSPGRDYSRGLRGESIAWDNVVFYEMETTRAVRTDRRKHVKRHPSGPHEMYDMRSDPQERVNVYGQPNVERMRGELEDRLTAFFKEYADPQYDLWKNGRSKASLHSKGDPWPPN